MNKTNSVVLSREEILSKDNDYVYNEKSGFIIFVHYKMALTEKMLRKHEHIYENVRDEFRTLHDITVLSLQNLGNISEDKARFIFHVFCSKDTTIF